MLQKIARELELVRDLSARPSTTDVSITLHDHNMLLETGVMQKIPNDVLQGAFYNEGHSRSALCIQTRPRTQLVRQVVEATLMFARHH